MKFTKEEYKKGVNNWKIKSKYIKMINKQKIINKYRRKNQIKWDGLFKN